MRARMRLADSECIDEAEEMSEEEKEEEEEIGEEKSRG